jgi:hypothetical protein
MINLNKKSDIRFSVTTSSARIREVLETLMQRDQWYTIPQLEDLALTVIAPDEDDLVVREYVYDEGYHQYPEWRFRRQVKNAVQPFRDEDHPAIYEGGQGIADSRYMIPLDCEMGVEDLEQFTPEEICQLVGSEQPNIPHFSNDGWGAEQFVLNYYVENGFLGMNVRSRNLGFDLLIQTADSDVSDGSNYLFVEVKSCSNGRTRPLLTEFEWAAAQRYGNQYRVVCVDNWNGHSGEIVELGHPVNEMNYTEIQQTSYRLRR